MEHIIVVICPHCGKTITFNDTNIPNGQKYEMTCCHCGILIIRQKQ